MQCIGRERVLAVGLGLLGFFEIFKIFLDASIVDAQELVGSGSHVDMIRLPLRAFLIHEPIYRVVYR